MTSFLKFQVLPIVKEDNNYAQKYLKMKMINL